MPNPTSQFQLDPDKVYALLNSEAQGHIDPQLQPYVDEIRRRGMIPPALPKVTAPTDALIPKNKITGTEEAPSVGGFIKNVGTSGLKFGYDTAVGAADIVGGGLSLMSNMITDPLHAAMGSAETAKKVVSNAPAVASNLWDFYKKRYGGVDNILHTAYTDPVGTAADVSMLAGGAEAGLKSAAGLSELAGASKTAGTLMDVAGTASKVSKATDPMSILRVPQMPKKAESLMTSALNPSNQVLEKEPKIARKALKYGTTISESGMAENQGHINMLMQDLQNRINELDAAGVTVDPTRVISSPQVQDVRKSAWTQISPMGDPEATKRPIDDFFSTHGSTTTIVNIPTQQQVPTGILDAQGNPIMKTVTTNVPTPVQTPRDIPAREARDLVSGTYKNRADSYLLPREQRTGDAAQMAMASAILDELENSEARLHAAGQLPDRRLKIAGMNLKDRIELQGVIKDALIDESRSNPFLKTLSGAMGTTSVALALGHQNVAAAATGVAAARMILQRKDVQSKIAQMLNKGSRLTPRGTTALTRQAGIFSGDSLGPDDESQVPQPPVQR